ncbi:chondroitin 4-O-sulfotransferase [Burkholderia dolosa]|uniref:chondroitin 4-O-sulfotransferase n=1 Tax=Burkholderia dolosa TaxID=152500 RepID=UPI001B9075E1|nr:chondroitin 4-O-sulfotransferase [Burkholderia dolosa]MBR8057209.1 chondroitin 4-O-sulfotransferase [Burkholderia dolosa]MBR8455833.1 chondroitin 4-O-sulfotransferase [Burkholderia dolosa]MDN7420271.1 chondroitin 4-O-sulfotransferase [Burkholderia dolosa]
MKPPIFFLHPPKCGGTSVISFFNLNRGHDRFTHFEWSYRGWSDERERLVQSGYGGGHHPFGIHRALRIPLHYCTILRDPLERQVSYFFYALNGKNGEVERGASISPAEAFVRRGLLSLDEWVMDSLGGRNVFVNMISGLPHNDGSALKIAKYNLQHTIGPVGTCADMSSFLLRLCSRTDLDLPFYVEANKTQGGRPETHNLSDAAKARFREDNKDDYALLAYAESLIAQAEASSGLFEPALQLTKKIQTEINALRNPFEHASMIFGFDQRYLDTVRELIASYDLAPINHYLEAERQQAARLADLYEGFVDHVDSRTVRGWAVNLAKPEASVDIEVWAGEKIVAHGSTGQPRPDVEAAGYAGANASGFTISLPTGVDTSCGLRIEIAHTSERLNGAGTWRNEWHCA